MQKLQEIRMRIDRPPVYFYNNKRNVDNGQKIYRKDIDRFLDRVFSYSMYAYENEIRQGYVTIRGGHRIGIAGRTVVDNERISTISDICFINIRISHEVQGCADKVMNFVCENNNVNNTLVISPPGCGKTTMLRDIVRQLSNGCVIDVKNVGVVDERSEIGACYKGIPQNDLGMNTDVLDGCPKDRGMMMMVRSMKPDVIAVDELGTEKDTEAVKYIVNSGCRIIATIHGFDIDEIRRKPALKYFFDNKIFKRFIVLTNVDGIGTVKEMERM